MNRSLIIIGIAVSVFCGGCQSTNSKTSEDECISDEFNADQAIKNGDYATADKLYQDAILKAKSSENALQLPAVFQEQGDLYDLQNKLDKAETCLRTSLAAYAELNKPSAPGVKSVLSKKLVHEGTTKSLIKLAHVLERAGKVDEAAQRYREALDLNKSSGGQVDESLSITKNYTKLLRKSHKVKEAEELEADADSANLVSVELDPRLWKQISIFDGGKQFADSRHKFKMIGVASKRFGKNSLFCTAKTYQGLAEYSLNEMPQAEKSLREVVETARTLPHDEHYNESLSSALGTLGCLLVIEGKDTEASLVFKESETLDIKTLVSSLFHVMNTAMHKGSRADAMKLGESMQKLVDESPKKSPKLYKTVTDSWLMLSDWIHQQKDFQNNKVNSAQYRYMVKKALAAYALSDKSGTIKYGDIIARSAESEFVIGNFAAGIEQLDKAYAMAQKHPSDVTAFVCEYAARRYEAQKNLEKAKDYYKKAISLYENSHSHPDLIIPDIDATVRILQTAGQLPLAVSLCQRGLSIAEAKIPSAVPGRLNQLAACYRSQNKLAEAERLHRRALTLCDKEFGPKSEPTASTLNQLADCLLQEHKDAEAKTYYERVLSIYQYEFAGKIPERKAAVEKQLALIAKEQGKSPQK